MSDQLEVSLYLLSQFTGTGGGPSHAIVHYTIQAFFWGALVVLVRVKRQVRPEPHETLLLWGFSFGLARELFMILVKVLEAYGVLRHDQLHIVFPPLEHALSNLALVVVAGAFVYYLTNQEGFAKRYLKAAVTAVVLCYLATFWWWAEHIIAFPQSRFGQTWCDWAFRINACILLGLPLAFLWFSARGWIRNLVCFSLTLFFLNEFLKIVDLAFDEVYEPIFAPVRHALSMIAIPPLAYLYVKDQALTIQQTLDTLEERVRERTAALANANAQLLEMSSSDSLTGLKNRRYFTEAFDVEWQRAYREHTPLSVLLVDADHFKRINDTHGHQFGDVCLRHIATTIRDVSKRSTDIVARYGGEEFVVLLANTPRAGAEDMAKAICSEVAALSLRTAAGEPFEVTVSIGVASVRPHKPAASFELINRADLALYVAKEEGRNRVRIADDRSGSTSESKLGGTVTSLSERKASA